MKTAALTLLASIGIVFSASTALAGDKPPADVKKLSEIVLILEKAGYDPISEIEFDDGHWEVDAYRDDKKIEVNVNPTTGEITKDM